MNRFLFSSSLNFAFPLFVLLDVDDVDVDELVFLNELSFNALLVLFSTLTRALLPLIFCGLIPLRVGDEKASPYPPMMIDAIEIETGSTKSIDALLCVQVCVV